MRWNFRDERRRKVIATIIILIVIGVLTFAMYGELGAASDDKQDGPYLF